MTDEIKSDHLSALVKHWQENHGLEADGIFGPATEASVEAAITKQRAPEAWQAWQGPHGGPPKGLRAVYQMFGDPGVGKADPDWVKANIVYCHPSNGNALPGVPKRLWVPLHRKVEPYAREALRRAVIACPDWKPERVAGFVFRHQRHDSNRPLSKHAFGCALDFDPHKNFAKTFSRSKAPEAWSNRWDQIWPDGLPKDVVDAFKSCGFAWGADWDEDGETSDHRYIDPMHFEWIDRAS